MIKTGVNPDDKVLFVIKPPIEDQILYEVALRALHARDDDSDSGAGSANNYEGASLRNANRDMGQTVCYLSGMDKHELIFERGRDLEAAFIESGFDVNLSGLTIWGQT